MILRRRLIRINKGGLIKKNNFFYFISISVATCAVEIRLEYMCSGPMHGVVMAAEAKQQLVFQPPFVVCSSACLVFAKPKAFNHMPQTVFEELSLFPI